MLTRILGSFGVAALALTGVAWGQSSTKPAKEPVADGRPLSAWVADLKAPSPETRNAAAYEIAGLGPSAAAAVPALIDALNDPEPSVRLPVAVALREIGPAAKAAVPALTNVRPSPARHRIPHPGEHTRPLARSQPGDPRR